MPIPYLAGVIELKDVKEKGTGFKAKYMAWAKVAQLFNEHCKGWTFHLRPSKEGHLLWEAPLGAYLLCYFKDPSGKEYSDFPYAVMDNRNNAIPVQKITARDISDSARRAFPAACAMQFSLGFELWAQEEIERNELSKSERDWRKKNLDQPNTSKQTYSKEPPDLAKEDDLITCRSRLSSLYMTDKDKYMEFESDYCVNFNFVPTPQHRLSAHIQEPKHTDFVLDWFDKKPDLLEKIEGVKEVAF